MALLTRLAAPRPVFSLTDLQDCEVQFSLYRAQFITAPDSVALDEFAPGPDFHAGFERIIDCWVRICSRTLLLEPIDQYLPIVRFTYSHDTVIEHDGATAGTVIVTINSREIVEVRYQQPSIKIRFTNPKDQMHRFKMARSDADEFCTLTDELLRIYKINPGNLSIWEKNLWAVVKRQFDKLPFKSVEWFVDAKEGEEEKLLLDSYCLFVQPLVSNPCRLILTQTHMYLQPFNLPPNPEPADFPAGGPRQISHWPLKSIVSTYNRRYRLYETAIEIYLGDGLRAGGDELASSGESIFLDFGDAAERCKAVLKLEQLTQKILPSLEEVTSAWVRREISNFEYIMELNRRAERTCNDLAQYPVCPWVITNYTSDRLDLSDPRVFRDLSRPIGALNPTTLDKMKKRYREMSQREPRFLYGSHYSTPSYVLYYLVRQDPEMMLRFTNGTFDLPDRLFFSMAETWSGVLNNPSDYKELIPQFYNTDGQFLVNKKTLKLGTRQDGSLVGDVLLPPWAASPKDFIATLRQALESPIVSAQLHKWIDLIFGYKQRGEEAAKADNLYHHLTYRDNVDLESITDKIERQAIEVQMIEFGQTPPQLFIHPHVQRPPEPLAEEVFLEQRAQHLREILGTHSVIEDEATHSCIKVESLHFIVSIDDETPGVFIPSDFLNLATKSSPVFVVGAPGSGKSCILRSLLLAQAQISLENADGLIPVQIPCRDIMVGSDRTVIDLLGMCFGPNTLRHRALSSAIVKGKVLFLLDGVDESGPNKEKSLRHILSSVSLHGCPLIFTSRDASELRTVAGLGKLGQSLANKARYVQVHPLSEEMQRSIIVHRLEDSVKQLEGSYESGEKNILKTKAAMNRALRLLLHPTVRSISSLPLLMSCLVALLLYAIESGGVMLEDVAGLRFQFYERCIRQLLYIHDGHKSTMLLGHDENRAQKESEERKLLESEDCLAFLHRLATKLQGRGGGGGTRHVFDDEDVRDIVAEGSAGDSQNFGKIWGVILAWRCPLFVKVNESSYKFAHPAFQDCLAARSLHRNLTEKLTTKSLWGAPGGAFAAVFPDHLLFSTSMRQTLKMCVSMMENTVFNNFIGYLVDHDDPSGGAFELALSLVTERPVSHRSEVCSIISKALDASGVAAHLVQAMTHPSRAVRMMSITAYVSLKLPFAPALARLMDIVKPKQAGGLSSYLTMFTGRKDPPTIHECAAAVHALQLLGQHVPAEELNSIVTLFLALLKDTSMSDIVRLEAVIAVGVSSRMVPDVTEIALAMALLSTDEDATVEVRTEAQNQCAGDKISATLLGIVQTNAKDGRQVAVKALCQLRLVSPELLAHLQRTLTPTHPSYPVPEETVRGTLTLVSKLGGAGLPMIPIIAERYLSASHANVSEALNTIEIIITEAVKSGRSVDSSLSPALTSLAQSTGSVSESAIGILGTLSSVDERAVDSLVDIISAELEGSLNPTSSRRILVTISALGSCPSAAATQTKVLERALTHEDLHVRIRAADALLMAGSDFMNVKEVLLAVIEHGHDAAMGVTEVSEYRESLADYAAKMEAIGVVRRFLNRPESSAYGGDCVTPFPLPEILEKSQDTGKSHEIFRERRQSVQNESFVGFGHLDEKSRIDLEAALSVEIECGVPPPESKVGRRITEAGREQEEVWRMRRYSLRLECIRCLELLGVTEIGVAALHFVLRAACAGIGREDFVRGGGHQSINKESPSEGMRRAVNIEVIRTLTNLHQISKPTIPLLVCLLQHNENTIRAAAAKALGAIPTDEDFESQALAKIQRRRRGSGVAGRDGGPAEVESGKAKKNLQFGSIDFEDSPPTIDQPKSDETSDSDSSPKWCADVDTILEVSRALLQVVQDNDRTVVGSALAALKAIPGGVWCVLNELSRTLALTEEEDQRQTLPHLPNSPTFVADKPPPQPQMWMVGSALSPIPPPGKNFNPHMNPEDDKSARVLEAKRVRVIRAVAKLGSPALLRALALDDTLHLLIEAMEDGSELVRRAAVRTLADLHIRNEVSVHGLASRAGGDESETVRLEAAIALATLEVLGDETVDILTAAITDGKLSLGDRQRVVQVVGTLPPLPSLIKALVTTLTQNSNSQLSDQARKVLENIKVKKEEEAQALIQLLADAHCRPFVFRPLECFLEAARRIANPTSRRLSTVDTLSPPTSPGPVWGSPSLGISSRGGGGAVSGRTFLKLRKMAGWDKSKKQKGSLEASLLLRKVYWADAADIPANF